ncbi:MAG: glycosyltransferase family 2 protein [Candidatus Altiarchaeota archaeon]|nr:glycosyltransferase family 2 protein [Candidatus Altiarchaeota archaeon]
MIDELLAVIFSISIFTFTLWNILALLPERKNKKIMTYPTISVVIPAHNEEKVIKSTIQSVLDATYPKDVEVIVVDDGSKDDTSKIVSGIARKLKNVRLLKTNHLGKAKAVNHGIKNTDAEVVIMLDADSFILPDALIKFIEVFQDSNVGAASGIIRVVLNKNPLVWYQDFEYVLSSMWRYIIDKLDITYILPGFCAFRRRAIIEVGGFETDTLSEDFDIGLKLRKAGWHIIMGKSVMHTNVPQTLGGVARQRIRWGRGTMQVIRKHKDMVFNPRHGFIGLYGLPNQIYFFVQGIIILPITFYQVFEGYYKYFVSNGHYLSVEALKYFFGWASAFGAIELIYNVNAGVWPMSWTFPFFLVSYILTISYQLLACKKMDGFKPQLIFSLVFFFPYYLFTLLFFVIPLLSEIKPKKKQNKDVNIWEKNM